MNTATQPQLVDKAHRFPVMTMPVEVKVWGFRASFNRPEFPTERVSYLVPTPGAVRGILSAIYWKPEFHWRVRQIKVLKPLKYFSETRNEVSMRASWGSLRAPFLVDARNSNRLQRHTRGLQDVAYVFVAEVVPNEINPTLAFEELEKHTHIFNERVKIGRNWHTPYFGCREYTCHYGPTTGLEQPIPWTADLGRMTFDFNFRTNGMTYASHNNDCKPEPVAFNCKVENGVVHVPDEPYAYCGGNRYGYDEVGNRYRIQPPMSPDGNL